MASEAVSALKILEENGGRMELYRLAQELVKRRALGFGVEVEDLVYRLKADGKVNFDLESELVSSNINHSRSLCGKPDIPSGQILPQEEAEIRPPKCKCCGSRMVVKECSSIGMQQLGMYWLICEVCPKAT